MVSSPIRLQIPQMVLPCTENLTVLKGFPERERESEIERKGGRERGNLVAFDQCHFNVDT